MLKIEKTVLPSPEQWEIIIEGMRNPMNSWDRMDSALDLRSDKVEAEWFYRIGDNDHGLMTQLSSGGPVHAKYRRMIQVYITVNAPLYWWKEMDRYRFGVEMNSCSTMHKIHSKEFVLEDFSHNKLDKYCTGALNDLINLLNFHRKKFLVSKCKDHWWQMIQLLPSSYNQKRTVMLNYEVLANIYKWRRNHKLDEWHTFCDWIEKLPYADLIIGGESDG